MSEANHTKAKEFLENIQANESICVVHHDDLDGYAAGIIFYEYCKKKTKETENIAFTYGNNEETVLKQLKNFDKVIITDLGPGAIPKLLEGLENRSVLYVDHHQKEIEIPKTITEYRTLDQGYIPCSRTAYELCGGKKWLAVAGTMGDMGHKYDENKEFINTFLKERKIAEQKFLETVVYIINSFIIYFDDKTQKKFKKLKGIDHYKDIKQLKRYARQVDREIEKYVKDYKKHHEKLGIISYYELHPKYSVKSVVATKLGFMYTNDIIIFASKKGDIMKFSGRTQNEKANVIEVLKTGTKGLENAQCGGHIRAAGGKIQAKDIEKFKENLKKYKLE